MELRVEVRDHDSTKKHFSTLQGADTKWMPYTSCVRSGPDLGLDPQFWLLMAAVCLVAWDMRARHRWDYAWVLFIGAATWTLVELTLQLTAMRVMPVRTLFGNALPLHGSLPLQGAAEGGAFAVIGLFLGDRLLYSKTRAAAAVMLLVLSGLALLPVLFPAAEIGEVFSRRNMLASPSLLFCGLLVAVDFVFLLRWRVFRLRATAMFSVLAILGGMLDRGGLRDGRPLDRVCRGRAGYLSARQHDVASLRVEL